MLSDTFCTSVGGPMSRWRAGFESYGVRFQLETNRPDCLAPLIASLPPRQRNDAAPTFTTFRLDFDDHGRPVSVLVNGRPSEEELPAEAPQSWLLESLITLHVARSSPHVFVHAGMVRHRGHGILFPGRSFAGKTTLTAALLACGADYYSDDFAVIGSDGRVSPYHCPLRIRTPAGRIEKTAADFGAIAADQPVVPAIIVSTEYIPGADWQPAPVSSGECLLRMLEHAVAAQSAPERICRVLSLVARDAVCLTGPRGDANETARRILEYCDSLSATSLPAASCHRKIQPCCP